MRPSIVGFDNGTVVYDPDAETLAAWALTAHDRQCRECGGENSDSRCTAGEAYQAATERHTDIRGIEGV